MLTVAGAPMIGSRWTGWISRRFHRAMGDVVGADSSRHHWMTLLLDDKLFLVPIGNNPQVGGPWLHAGEHQTNTTAEDT